MERIRIAPEYDARWLEVERPQPLCDSYLESLFDNTVTGFNGVKPDHSLEIHTTFKQKATSWIFGSKLNHLSGFDSFNRLDLMIGCTQYIDNLYMQGRVQTLRGDYRYHERLGFKPIEDFMLLSEDTNFLISMPFPSLGSIHPKMTNILDHCYYNDIPVHIDGAWITCSKNIKFDFSHPAIRSVGISLSKGLGLGWNRIGLRWTKDTSADSISIMNDFHMECRSLSIIGNYILDNVGTDYLWNTYGHLNHKICCDFNLTPSNAIHMAFDSQRRFVGLSPLLRHLMK